LLRCSTGGEAAENAACRRAGSGSVLLYSLGLAHCRMGLGLCSFYGRPALCQDPSLTLDTGMCPAAVKVCKDLWRRIGVLQCNPDCIQGPGAFLLLELAGRTSLLDLWCVGETWGCALNPRTSFIPWITHGGFVWGLHLSLAYLDGNQSGQSGTTPIVRKPSFQTVTSPESENHQSGN